MPLVRWDELFADLEGQLEAGLTAEERDLEVEEERLRLGRSTLRDRVAATAAGPPELRTLRFVLTTGPTLELRPTTIGRDWIAGDEPGGAQAVLSTAGIAALLPDPAQLDAGLLPPPAARGLTDRLGLAFVLRDLARRRRTVEVVTPGGTLSGTFDRVGRDHADLAVHPEDQPRRAGLVRQIRVLPLTQVVLVRVR